MISKILLINSPRITKEQLNPALMTEVYPPLGLMYLSAMVKRDLRDIQVQVLDLHFELIKGTREGRETDIWELTKTKLDEFQPNLVGLTAMFGPSFPYIREVGIKIKQLYPNVITVAGGVHITAIAHDKEQLDFCDFVALNEAEHHFVGLIRYLNHQHNLLKGIVVHNPTLLRNKIDLIEGNDRPEDIDSLPTPDFGAVDLRNYGRYGVLSAAQTYPEKTPTATLLTARGCIARCKFCSVRSFNGLSVRTHSPKRVLEEIDILVNEFGIRHIDFVDDDLTFDPKRIIEICDGLIRRQYPLTWSIGNGIRVASLNDQLLDRMVRAGCTYFSLGIETGDPDLMREMRKPLTVEVLRKQVPLLKKYPQIYYRANWIVGYPGETSEQLARTFSLAEEIKLDWNLFSMCKPLPGTELYNELLQENSDFRVTFQYSFNRSEGMLTRRKVQNQLGESQGMLLDQPDSVFETAYFYNLKLNFKENVNLHGRNVERAVRDFERVLKITTDHAVAWKCLEVGYKKLGLYEQAEKAHHEACEILERNLYWRKKFEALNLQIDGDPEVVLDRVR